MKEVRLGVVGLGSMGMAHARTIADGLVERGVLAAVCSSDAAKRAQFPQAREFDSFEEMIGPGAIDAVVIATPHLAHPDQGIAALRAGLHVMMEKPIAASKSEGERLLAAHQDPTQTFAVMFNMRTRPFLRKVREMLLAGEVGAIRRFSWTATAFFRPEIYYASSSWRGTWAGEGGGVLLNQAPHHLDLIHWFFGKPTEVRAFCAHGKYHKIEVEDEVTAYLQFADGLSGTFVTSTGEAPGTTRIEIAGDLGRVVVENDVITFTRNSEASTAFSKIAAGPMDAPETKTEVVPAAAKGGNYAEMFKNFCDAILDRVPLIAPAADAIHSLELANAMLLSSLEERTISLPMNAKEYDLAMEKLLDKSMPVPPRA